MAKKTKKWPIVVAAVAGVGALAVWGISAASSAIRSLRPSAAQTAQVAQETIDTTVVGTGTLTYADQQQVMIPDGVEVTAVFYENGQTVEAGDLLASVDTASLELLMSETYQEISDVEAQMRQTPSEPELVVVQAPADGTVTSICAANGASVLETLAESGSLMLLSPDGRMQAEIETDNLPDAGSQITFVLPDGSRHAAEVEDVREKGFTAVLTGKGLAAGQTVQAQAADGTFLGSGQLEPADAVSVVGPAGTVEGITVSAGARVHAGQDLFSVRSSSRPAAYQKLENQRKGLTKKYDALAQLRQAGGLVAPVSGVITACSISEGSVPANNASFSGESGNLPASAQEILSAFGMERGIYPGGEKTDLLGLGTGGTTIFLSESADEPPEAPDDEPAEEPTAEEPAPEQPAETPEAPRIIPRLSVPIIPPIPNLPLQHDLDLLPLYSAEISWDPADEQAQYSTVYTAHVILHALEGFRFASDCGITVLLGEAADIHVDDGGGILTFTASYEKTIPAPKTPDIDWEAICDALEDGILDLDSLAALISSGLLPEDALNFDFSSLLGGTGLSSVLGSLGSADLASMLGSGTDLSALAGMDPQALLEAYGTTDLEEILASGTYNYEVEAYAIAPDDAMQLSIQINQMDVLSVTPGMPCKVTVDALEDESFDGTVAEIRAGETGSNSYTAQITFTKTADMLSGMSASAVITTSETDSAMTLPAAAIQEDGNRVFVYTTFDRANETFGGEKDIETGVSNGTDVEVLSGVEPGETVYYPAVSPMEQMAQMFGGPDTEDRAEISVRERADGETE